jgi:hypothetical protein
MKVILPFFILSIINWLIKLEIERLYSKLIFQVYTCSCRYKLFVEKKKYIKTSRFCIIYSLNLDMLIDYRLQIDLNVENKVELIFNMIRRLKFIMFEKIRDHHVCWSWFLVYCWLKSWCRSLLRAILMRYLVDIYHPIFIPIITFIYIFFSY